MAEPIDLDVLARAAVAETDPSGPGGHQLQALKLLRERTGLSLHDLRPAVDRALAGHAASPDRDDLAARLETATRLSTQYEDAARLANRNTQTASAERDAAQADAEQLRGLVREAWRVIHVVQHTPSVSQERCESPICRRLREAVSDRG
jgi:hypothetical protein